MTCAMTEALRAAGLPVERPRPSEAFDCLVRRHYNPHPPTQRRLSTEDVREIRNLYAAGEETIRSLARAYCVTSSVIHKVLQRRTYREVA